MNGAIIARKIREALDMAGKSAKLETFILRKDSRVIIDQLSNEQRGRLFLALFDYACDKIEPDFEGDPVLNMGFSVIRNYLDRDEEKYHEKCKKNSENIQKRYKKNDSAVNEGTESNTNVNEDEEQESTVNEDLESNTAVNDGKEPNTTVNEGIESNTNATQYNNKPNNKNNPNPNNKPNYMSDRQTNIPTHPPEHQPDHEKEIREIIDKWDSLKEYGISEVLSLDQSRKEKLNALITRYGLDKILKAIENAKKAKHLQGETTGFTMTFDWFLDSGHFEKVYSNQYRTYKPTENQKKSPTHKGRDNGDLIAGIEAKQAEKVKAAAAQNGS